VSNKPKYQAITHVRAFNKGDISCNEIRGDDRKPAAIPTISFWSTLKEIFK